MRKLAKAIGVAVALLLLVGGLFALEVLGRKRPLPIPSTTHASIPRSGCIECHAPIAGEWRKSYHYKSLNGPYWEEAGKLGYLTLFESIRKPCVNCHAPANVLDLRTTVRETQPGVECTPNLLKEPAGTIPAARSDDVHMGVDCTACHVSQRGIVGAGLRPTSAHETIADPRFQVPAVTVDTLCGTCHRATVNAWKRTKFAADGVTCLDCHMAMVRAPSVAGGPERLRRGHTFVADKDPAMLLEAVNASLEVTGNRKARFRITNDRVGHFFPSGGNWVSVHFKAYDETGRILAEQKEAFGRDEALLLDFWPFNQDNRIAFGERREILFPLPEGHGIVEAVVRYHDWMHTKRTITTLTEKFR